MPRMPPIPESGPRSRTGRSIPSARSPARAWRARARACCWCARGASRRCGAASGPRSRRIASADCALERWPRPPEMRFFSGQVYGPSRSMSSSWLISSSTRRGLAQEVHERLLGPAEVRGDDDARVVRLEGVGHGLERVVRRRERPEAEVPDPPVAARDDADERREEIALEADRRRGSDGRVDRAVPPRAEDERAAGVVVVLVRQEEARDRLGAKSPAPPCAARSLRAESPASTSTRVRPDSTTQALPPEPDARTVTRTDGLYLPALGQTVSERGRSRVQEVQARQPGSLPHCT